MIKRTRQTIRTRIRPICPQVIGKTPKKQSSNSSFDVGKSKGPDKEQRDQEGGDNETHQGKETVHVSVGY